MVRTLMLSLGTCTSVDLAGRSDDGRGRVGAAVRAAFELGPAWQGGQDAIFLKTDRTAEDVFQHLLPLLDDRDLLLVVEIADGADVRFAGSRFDEDGFDEIFPAASEVEHLNVWGPYGAHERDAEVRSLRFSERLLHRRR
ncbi:MAG: hypothetical protein A2623_07405 [Caulobacterales bacterium RIFCSPHIGHO2_01_FULL_70_19]|nr:MAG: hypothetical protein A2623_07405 [Caulobacterales bacterium RIFCSPHIGHO2_01_FULL_70_19]